MSVITIYAQGTVTEPTTANAYGAFGYDNGGFFGPAYTNLGGDKFLITWTGTPSTLGSSNGSVTGATLTINGITVDMGVHIIPSYSEFIEHPQPPYDYQSISIYTAFQSSGFPPIVYGTQYRLGTNSSYPGGAGGAGVAELLNENISGYPTNMFLSVSHIGPTISVPGPELATGWPGLILATAMLVWMAKHRRRKT